MQQVAGGGWEEGGGLGVLEGEEVRGVCALGAAREGRAPQVPQWRHIRGAETGGGTGARGGVSGAKGRGEGSTLRRRSAPAGVSGGE